MARLITGGSTIAVTLSNASDNPVTVDATGTIASQGSYAILGLAPTAWRVDNAGLLMAEVAANGTALMLAADGTVANSGGISGQLYGVDLSGGVGFVANSGTITSEDVPHGVGVRLQGGGTIVNGSPSAITALIQGGDSAAIYVHGGAADHVTNFGSITGLGRVGSGVSLGSGGLIENGAADSTAASISAPHQGIAITGGTGTVVNSGTIAGSGEKSFTSYGVPMGYGVAMAKGGTVTNGAVGLASAMISGGNFGVAIRGGVGSVTNEGTILATISTYYSEADAVFLAAGGTVRNGAGNRTSAVIDGATAWGVEITGGSGTVSNDGKIRGGGLSSIFPGFGAAGGVYLRQGGTVINGGSGFSAASIIGFTTGVAISGGRGTVVNSGQIVAKGDWLVDFARTGVGIVLAGGGVVTNTVSGSISGDLTKPGILAGGGAWIVDNAGVINNGIESTSQNGGGTVVNVGMINGGITFAPYVANRLKVSPGSTISGQVDGGLQAVGGSVSVLELAAGNGTGTFTGFGSQFGNFQVVTFDPGATWKLSGSPASLSAVSQFTGLTAGDTIELTGVNEAIASFSNNVLQLTGDQPFSLNIAGAFDSSSFAVTTSAAGTDITVLCFAEGTLVDTAHGQVPVECLVEGEGLPTCISGEVAAIVWIGRREIDCRGHPRPESVWPVRVAAGAFGEGSPSRDLFLSPDHAVWLYGGLIPVKYLINGTSIARIRRDRITYFHVELPWHDVIRAENLAVETYLDADNRWDFDQSGQPLRLHPDFASRRHTAALWEAHGAAPLVVAGPALDAARRQVAAIANAATPRRRRSSAA